MISNVSFSARIERNDLFNEGIKFAKRNAHDGNALSTNEFVNAVNYLRNDGTDDVYKVVKDKERDDYYLLKNDEPVKKTGHQEKGYNVLELFTHYVMFDLNQEVFKPVTKTTPERVNFTDMAHELEDRKPDLSKDFMERFMSVKSYIDGVVADEVCEKINKLDRTI